jgi:hypothetical protein
MISIHEDLLAAVDAVEIESSTRYAILGEQRSIMSGGGGDSATLASALVTALARDLYERVYSRQSAQQGPRRADALARRDLVATLSRVNCGSGAWQAGWSVERIDDDGAVVVVKDDVRFWASRSNVSVLEGTVGPGANCRVRIAKELRRLIPGFYLAIGDTDVGDRTEFLDRYYWHLTADLAIPFLKTATSRLNTSRLPFRAKVLADPNAYDRADAGVLYLRPSDCRQLDPILAELYSTLASGLRPGVPLFTQRLADGLGYAQHPLGPLSFGEHRCHVVAQSLWQSFVQGVVGREARADVVAASFHQAGLDPTRPYLGKGWMDDPRWQLQPMAVDSCSENSADRTMDQTAGLSLIASNESATLAAAISIGQALCRSAYWDTGGRYCNWIGRSTAEALKPAGVITPTSSAIGADLYSGTAGIALFLAQLYAITGDPQFRRTAVGAIERSLRQLDRSPATDAIHPLGFFCGHLGVAYVARRVEDLTGHRGLGPQVDSIIDRAAAAISTPHEYDVISGTAGAIPSLLQLGRLPGLGRCLGLAITLSEELSRTAVRHGLVMWHAEGRSGAGLEPHPMTGLAHGVAGIGLALLEIHATTGRTDFLETARGAFAFVDSQFDPTRGNWADQLPSELSHGTSSAPIFSVAWCHGAPGIALAQIRAAALDKARTEVYLDRVQAAIAATLAAIDDQLEATRGDASLCHGLSGLGEVILIAGQLLEKPTYLERAGALARELIDRYGAAGDWPSGVPSGGPNPSLMLGLAGIGYWLLRLHNPVNVPPLLMLTST